MFRSGLQKQNGLGQEMPPLKKRRDMSPEAIAARKAASKEFALAMRQAVMEFDSLDSNRDKQLDFREFSRMIREREIGVHSEEALMERFKEIDIDGGGTIDKFEFIVAAIKDSFTRSAADIEELFLEWDEDGGGFVDKAEFRKLIRHYGFEANDDIIDRVFDAFDIDLLGELDLRDLRVRLEFESMRRNRPLQRLRAIYDRQESKNAFVKIDLSHLQKIDLNWGIPEQQKARCDRIRESLRLQSARVMDIFRTWDVNGDGEVSKQEFRDAIYAIEIDPSTWLNRNGDMDEKQMLADIDFVFESMKHGIKKSAVNTIAYHDLRKTIEGLKPPQVVELKKENLVKREKMESLSAEQRSASVMKNIKLSPDHDFISQLTAGLAANWSTLTALFNRWDIDGSGRMSLQELRQSMAELGLANPKVVDSFFNLLDVDQSGDISLEEFTRVVRGSMRDAASDRLGNLRQVTTTPRGSLLPRLTVDVSGNMKLRSPRNMVGGTPARQRTILIPPPVRAIVIPEHVPTMLPPRSTVSGPSLPVRVPYVRPKAVRAPPLASSRFPGNVQSH